MAKAKDCSTKLEATVKERDFQLLSAQNSAEELRAELKEKVNPTEDTYPGGNLIYHIMFKFKNDELIALRVDDVKVISEFIFLFILAFPTKENESLEIP